MIEETLHTPMDLADVCSEAGRFGVYCRLLEIEAEKVAFPYKEEAGFDVIFPCLFALIPLAKTNPDFLDSAPALALSCFDSHSVTGEDDTYYEFPLSFHNEEDNRLDMALLYVAMEWGLSRKEDYLAHLPYLFSCLDSIKPYVMKGYYLSEEARAIMEEVRADLASRLPEDLYESLAAVRNQIHQLREYYSNRF